MRVPVAATVLLLSSLLAGCTDFGDDGGGLQVQGIDVAAPEVGAGRLTLAVLITLDNDGPRSKELNLTVKAYDGHTGLLAGNVSQEVGRMAAHKTRTFDVRIELARSAQYRLAVDVQEDGQLMYRTQVDARNLAALEPNTHETGLRIAASDFRLLATNATRAHVKASVYLTNEGAGESRPLTLQVRAREEKTSLVVAEQWTSVDAIRPDATRLANVTLDVPTGRDYGVEVTLWDDDIIVERGSGRIAFGPVTSTAPSTGVVVTTPDLGGLVFDRGAGDGYASDKSNKTPGPGVVLVAIGLLGAVLVIRRRLA